MSGECDECGEHCLDCKCNVQMNEPIDRIEITLSKLKENYFLTDNLGNAHEISWNQLQEMLKIYVDMGKEVILLRHRPVP